MNVKKPYFSDYDDDDDDNEKINIHQLSSDESSVSSADEKFTKMPEFNMQLSDDDKYSVSNDEEKKFLKSNINQSVTPLQKSSIFTDIISQDKVLRFDFNRLKSSNTLFSQDITEDSEIWLVQSPNEVNLSTLEKANLDFDSVLQEIKCKSNKGEKAYTVHSVENTTAKVCFALPNLKKKLFEIKVLPTAGTLILRENIQIKRDVKDDLDASQLPYVKTEILPAADSQGLKETLQTKKEVEN